MDTIHEDIQTIDEHESDDEGTPLTEEQIVLLMKVGGTVILVGIAAGYGIAVASCNAGRFIGRKIQNYRSKKKEESTN